MADGPWKSPKWGYLGVHFECSGPDPSGPRPGERVIIVVLDEQGEVTRRLEQRQGRCLDGGYVDFFGGPDCRPAVYEMEIVDTDSATGREEVLAVHTTAAGANAWFKRHFATWCLKHGTERGGLMPDILERIEEKKDGAVVSKLTWKVIKKDWWWQAELFGGGHVDVQCGVKSVHGDHEATLTLADGSQEDLGLGFDPVELMRKATRKVVDMGLLSWPMMVRVKPGERALQHMNDDCPACKAGLPVKRRTP